MDEQSTTSMDRPRQRGKRRLRSAGLAAVALAVITATFAVRAVSRKPRALSVERATVVTDVVRSGEMLVQMHGNGTLVAEDARWLSALTAATVERIPVDAGGTVDGTTIILELSNPEVGQRATEALLALRAAEAESVTIREQWASQVLTQQAEVAAAEAAAEEARLRVVADRDLTAAGLLPGINMSISEGTARQQRTRHDVARAKLASAERMRDATAVQQEARLAQLRAVHVLRASEADALHVRAGSAGVVQRVAVEVGQQVAAGSTLALLADPRRLKARILIPETQARDVRIGQSATIDTRTGTVAGEVARVDAVARNGSVIVDVRLTGPLPEGVRPDLNVDGTIDVARIGRALHVGRPALAANGSTTMFKLTQDGSAAVRTPVTLGRISATRVEILSGLAAGDVVITSDIAEWNGVNRLVFD